MKSTATAPSAEALRLPQAYSSGCRPRGGALLRPARRRHNLRQADRAVEETEIGAYIVAFERIGQDGEWEREHCSPCAAYEEITDEKKILIGKEEGRYESNGSEQEAKDIDGLVITEAGMTIAHITEPMAWTAKSVPTQLPAS